MSEYIKCSELIRMRAKGTITYATYQCVCNLQGRGLKPRLEDPQSLDGRILFDNGKTKDVAAIANDGTAEIYTSHCRGEDEINRYKLGFENAGIQVIEKN